MFWRLSAIVAGGLLTAQAARQLGIRYRLHRAQGQPVDCTTIQPLLEVGLAFYNRLANVLAVVSSACVLFLTCPWFLILALFSRCSWGLLFRPTS